MLSVNGQTQQIVGRTPAREVSSRRELTGADGRITDRSPLPPLPQPLTSFIGRTHELAEAARLLERTRLLTLIGPAGVGKTRFALQLATSVAPIYTDGVCFVSLAAVAEPVHVLTAMAQALEVRESEILLANPVS